MTRLWVRAGLGAWLLIGACALPVAAQTVGEISEQKEQAAARQKVLQQRIEELQKRLTAQEQQRKRASDALRESEVAISEANRKLSTLQSELKDLTAAQSALAKTIQQQQASLERDRQSLADQLRAQYTSGLSPWSALLSGEDPLALGRELGYLAYVSRAQADAIEKLKKGLAELSALEATQAKQQENLEQTRVSIQAEQKVLGEQKKVRSTLLARLEGQISAQRAERDRLAEDERTLSSLIDGLNEQIEKFRADAKHAAAIREEILASLPQGVGLKRGIPMPVKGPILARFGSNRLDGGAWRGVLIGAETGVPVRSVAAGTVVYATWLRGFGNLIIVDHGDEFLTVYAHNQSLLKRVGEAVRAQDVIAQAGNTGGQLDSALYFEIRHRGQPLDPMLYLKQ
jgi:murein hydrolase activator